LKALTAVAALVLAAAPFAPAEAQWVFVARKAMQRIHHMTEGGNNGQPRYEFATVILEAPADRGYTVALEHARQNRAVQVTMVDPGNRRLQVVQGDRVATLNVVSLNNDVSQLMISGSQGANEDSTSSRIVEAVMRVCAELKKECSVE